MPRMISDLYLIAEGIMGLYNGIFKNYAVGKEFSPCTAAWLKFYLTCLLRWHESKLANKSKIPMNRQIDHAPLHH